MAWQMWVVAKVAKVGFSMGFWVLLIYGFLGFDGHEFVVGVSRVAVVKMTLVFN